MDEGIDLYWLPLGAGGQFVKWNGRVYEALAAAVELRCWRDGTIPDVAEAVASPVRVSDDTRVAQRVLELAPRVPPLVWGRDELRGGEMWNSNSIVAWLLVSAGVDAASIPLPPGGRAPGWNAGAVVASRGR